MALVTTLSLTRWKTTGWCDQHHIWQPFLTNSRSSQVPWQFIQLGDWGAPLARLEPPVSMWLISPLTTMPIRLPSNFESRHNDRQWLKVAIWLYLPCFLRLYLVYIFKNTKILKSDLILQAKFPGVHNTPGWAEASPFLYVVKPK